MWLLRDTYCTAPSMVCLSPSLLLYSPSSWPILSPVSTTQSTTTALSLSPPIGAPHFVAHRLVCWLGGPALYHAGDILRLGCSTTASWGHLVGAGLKGLGIEKVSCCELTIDLEPGLNVSCFRIDTPAVSLSSTTRCTIVKSLRQWCSIRRHPELEALQSLSFQQKIDLLNQPTLRGPLPAVLPLHGVHSHAAALAAEGPQQDHQLFKTLKLTMFRKQKFLRHFLFQHVAPSVVLCCTIAAKTYC